MTKVISRIKGGLGNQLFCYAAARRLALVNNAELVLDDTTGFDRDHVYKREFALNHFCINSRIATPWERMEPFERYRRGLAKWVARKKQFHKREYIQQEGNSFDPRLLKLKVKKTIYLDGYWQSERYFIDIEKTIRNDLTFRQPTDSKNISLANQIRKSKSVAIHIRWFDQVGNNSSLNNASECYYDKAIKKIKDKLSNPHFFVFSDDSIAAHNFLGLSGECVTYINHNNTSDKAYADLWLMSLCNHFIIANSTFSWWGAWLSENKSKIIIAPSMKIDGITAWGFQGLIPKYFTVI